MSEYDMSIHSNPSAKAWAELYKKTFPAANEDLMHSWFANAMMAMHDHLQNGRIAELEQQLTEARELLSADQHDRLTGSWEARRNALLGEESEITTQIIVTEEQIKEVDRELMVVRGASRGAPNLEEKLSWQKKQRELEGKRSKLRQELFRLMDLESE